MPWKWPFWLTFVASKFYIGLPRRGIKDLHGCDSTHVGAVPVREVFRARTIWEGDVHVFDLPGHPKAKGAYARSYPAGPGSKDEQVVAALGIGPVEDAQSAVRAAIVSEIRNKKLSK